MSTSARPDLLERPVVLSDRPAVLDGPSRPRVAQHVLPEPISVVPRQRTRRHGGAGRPARRSFGAPAALMAAACWGTIGLATSLLPAGASPLSIASARMAVGGGLLMAIAGRPRAVRRLVSPPRAGRWLILAMVAMAVNQLVYFIGIQDAGPALTSVVMMASIPVFAGLISRLCGVRLSPRWQVTTAVAVVGCVLLVLNGIRVGDRVVLGVGCALAAGGLYTIFTIFASRLIATGGEPMTIMAVVFGGAGLVMSPILVAGHWRWVFSPVGAGVTLYLGLAATVGAYLLYGQALKTVSVPVISTLMLAEPATATLISLTVLGEHLDPVACGGLALICATLVATAMPDRGLRRRRLPRHAGSRPGIEPVRYIDERVRWTPAAPFPSLD